VQSGPYREDGMHCHTVVHEDHAMMIRFDIGTIPPDTAV
jgi:FtsP/CotA-like multicopper oxidase with cupredoxin domain